MTRRSGLSTGALTEAHWQRQVYDLLDLYAWDYKYHVVRSKMTPWGWPDIVAIRRRDRRLLFAELKTVDGATSDWQLGLLELLLDVAGGGWMQAEWPSTAGFAAGHVRVDVELWRPGDIDRVMEVLK